MRAKLVEYLNDNKDQIIETWLTDLELPIPETKHSHEEKDCTCGGACASLKGHSCKPTALVETQPALHGTVTVSYLSGAFEAITAHITSKGAISEWFDRPHFDQFIGITSTCSDNNLAGRVCIDLYSSGYRAFRSIFNNGWDSDEEFSDNDQDACMDLIQQALVSTLRQDIELCTLRAERADCPFAEQ
ncbi:MAG: hypothetical protein HRU10_05510 [Opitutales bacterium]|nr:hypothetical protein [Opitutales bacterium]